MVAHDHTLDDKVAFELSKARGGSVQLLADGHTARFTPLPDYHGAASFQIVARDRSIGSRLRFLYDFEPPDLATDGKVTDGSNANRAGTLETGGTGGEFAYSTDVPALLAPFSTGSLSLTEATTGAARLRRNLAVTDQDYNDADWTFSAWVKRASRDTDDIILHLGNGDGFGPDPALQLYFPANSDTLKVGKYGAAGLEKEAVGPALPVGTWHHVTLTYDRTATNVGTLALYVNGFAYGSVANVTMDVSQSTSMNIGGASSTTSGLAAWFDGKLEDVSLQSGISSRAEIWGLAHMGSQHFQGLTASGTVSINVTGSNQAPSSAPLGDIILPVGATVPPVAVTVTDPETHPRSLAVSASSSNTALLPATGIAVSAAPAAWTNSDIGTVGAAGSLVEDHGTFIISGAGTDIGPATGDKFRWVRQDFSGDAEFFARVVSMDFTNTDAKAGIMMRNGTTTTSPYAFVAVTPGSGVTFQTRATESSAAVEHASVNGIAAPCWVRLVRSGSTFTAFYATDNSGVRGAWQTLGTGQTVAFAAGTNAVGMGVTSKVDTAVCAAVFDSLGGTVKLGGERTLTLTPTAGASGSSIVTIGVNDGTVVNNRTFNLIMDGVPPTTSTWNATTAGNLLWSSSGNWSGGAPPNSRFATVQFFTGQTIAAGSVTAQNDAAGNRALNVLTLGGTGPTTGTAAVTISGNPILFRRETVLNPVVNLAATNGTGLSYLVSTPLVLETTTTFQGSGGASFHVSGAITGEGGLVKSGSSRLILSGSNGYLGETTISGGTLQIGNDGASGTLPPGPISNNGTLRFDRTGTLTVPNIISGTGGITIDCPLNAGTIVLSGANRYTGTVTITSGALRIQNSAALGTGTKTIAMSNGTAGAPQLRLDGSAGDLDLPSSIAYLTSNVNGSVFNEAGNNILRGNFTLTSGGGDTRVVASAGSLTLTGAIAPNTTSRNFVMAGTATGFVTGNISNGTGGQHVLRQHHGERRNAGTWESVRFREHNRFYDGGIGWHRRSEWPKRSRRTIYCQRERNRRQRSARESQFDPRIHRRQRALGECEFRRHPCRAANGFILRQRNWGSGVGGTRAYRGKLHDLCGDNDLFGGSHGDHLWWRRHRCHCDRSPHRRKRLWDRDDEPGNRLHLLTEHLFFRRHRPL
jgi:autotransporter-associated beta strand protein